MKKLERTLSLPYVVAIAIGGMLGSGIFVLPGLAAAKTGPSIWMAYLVAGICVLPAALSKSELSTAMPTSGGTYIYLERVFGPLMGTISGFGLWFSLLLKSSFALVGVSAYLNVLADVPLKLTSLVLLSIIVGLNIMGVKKVGLAQLVIVTLSLICL
ncbi:MAG: amino acid permease, partial [Bacteroidota bacterium]